MIYRVELRFEACKIVTVEADNDDAAETAALGQMEDDQLDMLVTYDFRSVDVDVVTAKDVTK